MVINTLSHNYYVIQKLAEEKEFETYLCYMKEVEPSKSGKHKSLQSTGDRYRVIRLMSKELTYRLISIFMEQKNNFAFEDFYECFSKDSYLYVVFLHYDNGLLEDKLSEGVLNLKERLEVGKQLLERVILLDMPLFLLYDALSEASIVITPSLEVRFNYKLMNIQRFDKITFQDIMNHFVHIFGKLFLRELELEASVDIKTFTELIHRKEYKNYFELYQEYSALYEKLRGAEQLESIKPNTFAFRFWNQFKSLGKLVKPILFLTVLLSIVGYLIYSIINRPVDQAAVSNFEQIGTVTIEGAGTEE